MGKGLTQGYLRAYNVGAGGMLVADHSGSPAGEVALLARDAWVLGFSQLGCSGFLPSQLGMLLARLPCPPGLLGVIGSVGFLAGLAFMSASLGGPSFLQPAFNGAGALAQQVSYLLDLQALLSELDSHQLQLPGR